jgi:hypothetical protein
MGSALSELEDPNNDVPGAPGMFGCTHPSIMSSSCSQRSETTHVHRRHRTCPIPSQRPAFHHSSWIFLRRPGGTGDADPEHVRACELGHLHDEAWQRWLGAGDMVCFYSDCIWW